MLLIILSIALPLIALGNYLEILKFAIPIYAWGVYLLIFNTVALIFITKIFASSIAYPFSNTCFKRHLRNSTNLRFGLEFRRCIQRMTRMIKETTER